MTKERKSKGHKGKPRQAGKTKQRYKRRTRNNQTFFGSATMQLATNFGLVPTLSKIEKERNRQGGQKKKVKKKKRRKKDPKNKPKKSEREKKKKA